MPARLQRGPNGADPAIHHVRRRDDVGTCLGLHQRLPDQDLARLVVEDIAGLVDEPVMAMFGIGIERDVGEHSHLGRWHP